MDGSNARSYVGATCPHCNATYQYDVQRVDLTGGVTCQNCGKAFVLEIRPSETRPLKKELSQDFLGQARRPPVSSQPAMERRRNESEIAWPMLCLGCGSQTDLITIDEPFTRTSLTNVTDLGMVKQLHTKTYSGTAKLSLCPRCKANAARLSYTRVASGNLAALTSFVILVLFWLPYGPASIFMAIVAGLWIPLLFLWFGPLRPRRFFDAFGKIGIQSLTGGIGFSFKNMDYYLAFSQANPHLRSWHWGTSMPPDYAVTKESTRFGFEYCISCNLFCTFIFGLFLMGMVGRWSAEGNKYGLIYVVASLLVALGVGAAIMLPSEVRWRRNTKT